jgi:hypothetical protein
VHGNFGAHDQEDDNFIDLAYVQPCVHSLDYVCQWFFDNLPPIVYDGPVIVKNLAEELALKPHQVIAELMIFNLFLNINQTIPDAIAKQISENHGRTIVFKGKRPVSD